MVEVTDAMLRFGAQCHTRLPLDNAASEAESERFKVFLVVIMYYIYYQVPGILPQIPSQHLGGL